jgi:hypothetical protein
MLHALITKFEFRLAVPKDDIVSGSGQVTRAFVRGREQEGPRLPVLIRLITEED